MDALVFEDSSTGSDPVLTRDIKYGKEGSRGSSMRFEGCSGKYDAGGCLGVGIWRRGGR